MSRQNVIDIVANIKPFDAQEQVFIEDALFWLRSGQEIYRLDGMNTPPKHLVSYFVVFDETAQKLLLVDHKKAGRWLPTGGHVDVDEHPKETVRRECLEELYIEADFWREDPLFITITPTTCAVTRHLDVTLWYVLRGDHAKTYNFDAGEFHSISWFDWDDIPERADPHMQRFVEKLKNL